MIEDGGWHFSYMGGIEKVLHKIDNWTHIEYNTERYNKRETVLNNILNGRDLFEEGMKYELVDINNTKLPFPKEILQHQDRWAAMLRTPEQLKAEVDKLLAK
ncbi:hypothetical protein D3C72_2202550 [compost metagenome]